MGRVPKEGVESPPIEKGLWGDWRHVTLKLFDGFFKVPSRPPSHGIPNDLEPRLFLPAHPIGEGALGPKSDLLRDDPLSFKSLPQEPLFHPLVGDSEPHIRLEIEVHEGVGEEGDASLEARDEQYIGPPEGRRRVQSP